MMVMFDEDPADGSASERGCSALGSPFGALLECADTATMATDVVDDDDDDVEATTWMWFGRRFDDDGAFSRADALRLVCGLW